MPLDLEALGNLRFRNIKQRYECHKGAVASWIVEQGKAKPVVFWLSYSSWTSPPAFTISRQSYVQDFITDAGKNGQRSKFTIPKVEIPSKIWPKQHSFMGQIHQLALYMMTWLIFMKR